MIDRREFLGISLGAGATLALTSDLLRAFSQSGSKVMQRAIPSSGEMLPVISFAPRPTAAPAPGPIPSLPTDVPAAREVLKAFLDAGKVVDVLHGGPIGEDAARTAARELGIQDKCFWTTPVNVMGPMQPGTPPGKPDAAAVRAHIEEKLARFKASRIEVAMVGAGSDASLQIAALREMKKEGRVRYIGVHTLLPPPNFPIDPIANQLESIMRNEQVDFIGADYSVGDRRVEEKILPLAQERKIGFLAYFTFDRGRLFKRASNTPLPEWAAEFDAKTWAQFFLKYVLGHPAVIVARTGTTNATHMLDNIAGGIGRLPNDAMRKRMAQFVATWPPTPPAGPSQPPPSA